MHEIKPAKQLDSLSLFVGTGRCNANCSHCAGKPLRKYAPKQDGEIDQKLFYNTIQKCYGQGARSLSISSSGEPTLSPVSVTKTLELISGCRAEGIVFKPINLYSNGIRIGEDKAFCDTYLPTWKQLGLTSIYLTVHSINNKENAKSYGRDSYPSLDLVLSRVHESGLLTRANLLLTKEHLPNLNSFVLTVEHLKELGIDYISTWLVRDKGDKPDKQLSISESELDKIEDWIENRKDNFRIRLLREKSREAYTTGRKLTLFPNGELSSSWCNY